MRSLPAAAVFLVVLAVSCGPRVSAEPPEGPAEAAAEAPKTVRPRLVVAVILDQYPAALVPRLGGFLDPDGLMVGRADQARLYATARYPYAGTSTAPGHASVHTGVPPRVHGIDTNDLWNDARAAKVTVVDDGEHEVLGVDGVYASPTALRAETLADRLKAQSPESRVVSLSMKARAAIVSAGQKPDFVAWYDRRAAAVTTSTYYARELPAWLSAWNRDNPLAERMPVWEADAPELYARLVGADDGPGEANWHGLGRTFPHDVAAAKDPARVWMATPASSQYLFDLARAAAAAYDLGGDDAVDLLCISVSTTDYAGHAFGTDSWEYLDVLRKVDRQLAAFLDDLERERGPVGLVITSDHGGGAIPEKSGTGGRIDHLGLVAAMDRAVDRAVGEGDWVVGFYQPYLNLTAAAQGERRDEVVAAITAAGPSFEGVQSVVDPTTLVEPGPDATDLERALWLQPAPDQRHLFVVPEPGYFSDPEREPGHGSNHGTPSDLDREVPIFVWGPGIAAEKIAETVTIFRATEELAALLGLAAGGG